MTQLSPSLVYGALVIVGGILAWVVSVVWKLEDRFVRADHLDLRLQSFWTKSEADDRFVSRMDLKEARGDTPSRAEIERMLIEAERRAIHTARNDMTRVIGQHSEGGHPDVNRAIGEIEKNVAVIQRVQLDQQRTLERQGELLEDIRETVKQVHTSGCALHDGRES